TPHRPALPSAATATLQAKDFDPLGDGQEDPGEVGKAVDGNPATFWHTEQYVRFSQDKAGVGLIIGLDRLSSLHPGTVTTDQSGWSAAIYSSTQTPDALTTLDSWGKARAVRSGLGTSTTFELETTDARSVLLWITALPGPEGQQQLQVDEVRPG